jgi:hypothetical protein
VRREASDGAPRTWLAELLNTLLAERYGPGGMPSMRKISADIAAANDGKTISHGHIHNMLTGTADNLTDHTRGRLARFFGRDPAYFHPPSESAGPDPAVVRALAARLATFDAAQVDAIMKAIEYVDNKRPPEEPGHEADSQR